jgi:hypothetical protein
VQFVEVVLPADDVPFDGHAMHVALADAPTVVEYVRAAHSVQFTDPCIVLYLPAAHSVHVPPVSPVDPLLQMQVVKDVLPAGDCAFDGQALHVAFDDAPTAVEYLPDVHSVHTVPAVNVVYLPASHAVHVDAETAAEYVPGGQTLHVVIDDAPTVVEYVPDAHCVQPAAPANVLYLPVSHAVHVPPARPVEPASHVQLVRAALPAGDVAFDGHAMHAAIADDRTALEYVPDAQSVHAVACLHALYFPATHEVQTPVPTFL